MTALTVPELFAVLAVSILASLAVLWGLSRMSRSARLVSPNPDEGSRISSFLFHGDTLVHHDIPAPEDRPGFTETLVTWTDLRHVLDHRFNGLPHSLTNLPVGEPRTFDAQISGASFQLVLHRTESAVLVTMHSETMPSPFDWFEALTRGYSGHQARDLLDQAPLPLWKTDDTGRVIWRNAKSREIEQMLGGPPEPDENSRRFTVPDDGAGLPRCFELTRLPLDEGELHCATDITSVIQAESAQRDFVQTLAKTFAHLTTGLAVFDKNRRLALFNPALIDLSGLPVTFLSARPDVIRFFDELRERQVLPEPKNYGDWRAQIRDVIVQAHDGTYTEIWNLPAGVTYRVTGRPHPDGAVAFLFQDISAEVMQTRTFRSQLELSQSVIDGLDQAIVVLSSTNLVLMCNTAASKLLGIDPGASFADMALQDLLRACKLRFAGDALWSVFEADLRDGASHQKGPGRYLSTLAGERLCYDIKPLTGGARLLSFSVRSKQARDASVNAAE